ncbi:MAG: hypothetical protein H7Z37_15980 [Pyrinomonadaceae bacterium]|nr:hypothetical protein [Pyrinomonadaceae bacterium]
MRALHPRKLGIISVNGLLKQLSSEVWRKQTVFAGILGAMGSIVVNEFSCQYR